MTLSLKGQYWNGFVDESRDDDEEEPHVDPEPDENEEDNNIDTQQVEDGGLTPFELG